MSKNRYQHLLLGATALAAGVIGTLTRVFGSPKRKPHWTNDAKDLAHQVLDMKNQVNTNMLLGGIAGGIVAAATALLLAPKSGEELLDDLTHPFSKKHSKKASHHKNEESHSKKNHEKHRQQDSHKSVKAKKSKKGERKASASKKTSKKQGVKGKIVDKVESVIEKIAE